MTLLSHKRNSFSSFFMRVRLRRLAAWLHQFTHSRRTLVLAATLLVSVGVLFFSAHSAHAVSLEDLSKLADDSFWLSLLSRIMLYLSTLALKLTVFVLTFVIEIAGYNGYLDSTAVSVGWVMVRDLTNMIFVIALLLMSFGTILGLEQYEWKKMIVKLVMAAIFVNFSRIICALFIDAAQVVMTTFINGIAATAGGNLLQSFNLDKIRDLSPDAGPNDLQDGGIFAASIAAVFFSFTILATMVIFMIMLLVRMVVLWVLIVLSPLAFVLNVLPQTETYAKQWWSELGSNVVNGPVLLFFLWLSFVTLGNGKINQEIANNSNVPDQVKITDATTLSDADNIGNGAQTAGIGKAMNWNSMSNFAIGVAMLLVSIKVTQQIGGVGAGMLEKATDFGKKAALNLSGINAARWVGGKAIDKGKAAAVAGVGLVGAGLYKGLLANGVERAKNYYNRQVEGYASWRAQGPRIKKQAVYEQEQETDQNGNLLYLDDKGNKTTKVTKKKSMRDLLTESGEKIQQRNDDGSLRYVETRDADGNLVFEEKDTRGRVQRFLHNRHEKLVRSKKLLEKVQNQKKTREEMMDKRVTANPKYWMQQFEGPKIDAEDRMEQGQLEAEKMRSQAKTQQYQSLGKAGILNRTRYKDGKWQDAEKGTMAEMIAGHQMEAQRNESNIQNLVESAKAKYAKGDKGRTALEGKIKADLNVKLAQAETHKAEALAQTTVVEKMREQEKQDRKEVDDRLAEKLKQNQSIIEQEKSARVKQANDELGKLILENSKAIDAKYQQRVDNKEITQEQATADAAREKKEYAAEANEAFDQMNTEIEAKAAAKLKEMNKHDEHDAEGEREKTADVLSRTIAAEKAAHTEGAKVETVKKEKEKEYFGTHHGLEEIEIEAQLDQRNAAATSFVNTLKDNNLKKEFKKAAEAIKIANETGPDNRRAALDRLTEENVFVRALRASKEEGINKEAMTIEKSTAETRAEAEFVDKGLMGFSTPNSSLVPTAKRLADGMNSLTNEALGQALVDNLAFVGMETDGGTKALTDTMKRAALFGVTSKVNTEAYIDDAMGVMTKFINDVELRGASASKEEIAKKDNLLKIWKDELGVIEGDGVGKRVIRSNAKNASKIQNYAVTGGNIKLMRAHERIEANLLANPKNADGTDREYEDAARDELGEDYKAFAEEMKQNDMFMKEAASSFKAQALAAGHTQLGGHQKFDTKLGFHRMSTAAEAAGIMQAEVRKRGSKIGYQYHSLGDVNTSNGVLERIDATSFGDTIGQAKKYLEIKGIQDRTRDGMMGLAPSEERKLEKGFGLLGGSAEDIKKKFGTADDVDGKKNFIKNVILPQLAKGAKAFALVAQLKYDNVTSQEAEKGRLKLAIQGTAIKAENLVQFIDQVKNELGAEGLGDYAKEIEEARKAADATLKEKIEEAVVAPGSEAPTEAKTPKPKAKPPTPSVDDSEDADDDATPAG